MNMSEYTPDLNINMPNDPSIYQYQKGYADGYKRQRLHNLSQRNNEYNYIMNVLVVLLFFILFIILSVYVFVVKSGANSHYKGECLNNLATTYMTDGCLDN